MPASNVLLKVQDLTTSFETGAGTVTAVDRVSFQLRRGETLAVVGESGSGKSVMSLSIMGLLAPPGRVSGGAIALQGDNLLAKSER
jgi:ABC-type dipeptide/oligopeptide/nickel transport system ATPase component